MRVSSSLILCALLGGPAAALESVSSSMRVVYLGPGAANTAIKATLVHCTSLHKEDDDYPATIQLEFYNESGSLSCERNVTVQDEDDSHVQASGAVASVTGELVVPGCGTFETGLLRVLASKRIAGGVICRAEVTDAVNATPEFLSHIELRRVGNAQPKIPKPDFAPPLPPPF